MKTGRVVAKALLIAALAMLLCFALCLGVVQYSCSTYSAEQRAYYQTGKQTDAYLSYQKVKDGLPLSFSEQLEEDYRKDYPNDAYYDPSVEGIDSPHYCYYYELSDTLPKDMVVLNEYSPILFGSQNDRFLLYNPETVEDPYRALTPSGAKISLAVTGLDGSTLPRFETEVRCEDRAYLAEVWQLLLDAEKEEKRHDWNVDIAMSDLSVEGEIELYLDSSEVVYVELDFVKRDGKIFLYSSGRYLACGGFFKDVLEEYTAFLREIDVITPPAVTTEDPEWSNCPAIK